METGKQDACDSIMYGDCCSLSFNQGHISQPMIYCPLVLYLAPWSSWWLISLIYHYFLFTNNYVD